jgi:hypothetical protein
MMGIAGESPDTQLSWNLRALGGGENARSGFRNWGKRKLEILQIVNGLDRALVLESRVALRTKS